MPFYFPNLRTLILDRFIVSVELIYLSKYWMNDISEIIITDFRHNAFALKSLFSENLICELFSSRTTVGLSLKLQFP